MEKPFLTIEQQVELLRKRGMRVDGGTAPILMREGYYSVVNGYKEPFIDARPQGQRILSNETSSPTPIREPSTDPSQVVPL